MTQQTPTQPHELRIAGIVARFAQWGLNRPLGEPTLNDDGTRSGQVDILFEEAIPPVALEVTTIVDDDFLSTNAAAQLVAERLDRHARELDVGFWEIHLDAGTRIKPIEPELGRIMAAGVGIRADGIGLRRHRLPHGVTSLWLYTEAPSGARIGTWKGAGDERLHGIRSELDRAIRENAPKLAAMAGYERHLAVDVQALRSTVPGLSPPPQMPSSVEHLWVIRTQKTPGGSGPVVWLAPDELGWKVHGEPYEAF